MKVSSPSERDLRKKLLQLEAQAYRLELAADLQELRKPMTHLRQVPTVLSLLGGKASAVGAFAAALIAGRRGAWLIKIIPVVLAGVRIAKTLRATRRHETTVREIADS